jgi:hypothetical protein
LQYTVAQNQAVEKRGARVQADEREERFGIEFMTSRNGLRIAASGANSAGTCQMNNVKGRT